MTTEEKAREYDAAVKKVKDYYEGNTKMYSDIGQTLDFLFPKLKESENDERIRRAIINVFATHKGFEVFYGATVNDILSWLEKQVEPKSDEVRTDGYVDVQDMEQEVKQIEENISAEPGSIYSTVQKQADTPKFKVGDIIIHKELGRDYIYNPHKIIQVDISDKKYRLEDGLVAHFSEEDDYELVSHKFVYTPKFKVGDWCIENKYNTVFQITKVSRDTYTCRSNVGETYSCMHYSLEEVARLWTIQDAKDGDILCANQIIILFKQWEPDTNYNFVIAHAGIDISGKLQITDGHWLISNESKPATQEQRDLLFSKMKEVGYEWDSEKKELRKIEQKSAWSEEDEKHIMAIELAVNRCRGKWNCCGETCPISEHSGWLKSIKKQMKGE